MDWHKWHGLYRNRWPLKMRLRLVQRDLSKAMTDAPKGRIQVLSICAGDGRDLADVMSRHRRAKDVSAVLIELDKGLVADGRARFEKLGVSGQIDYRANDATDPNTYAGVEPADILLACGMLGLVSRESTPNLVKTLASLINPGGTLIWTRSLALRSGPQHLKQFETLLVEAGFEEKSRLVTPKPPFFLRGKGQMARFVVGANIFRAKKTPPKPRGPLFEINDL